jgi:hypothetical protein
MGSERRTVREHRRRLRDKGVDICNVVVPSPMYRYPAAKATETRFVARHHGYEPRSRMRELGFLPLVERA